MTASEKFHQNISDYNQLLFKKRFEVNKKKIFPSENMRNSGSSLIRSSEKILNSMYYVHTGIYQVLTKRGELYFITYYFSISHTPVNSPYPGINEQKR